VARPGAKVTATVRLHGEVTAEETLTVEVDEMAAVRAELRSPARVRLREARVDHFLKVGAVQRARLDRSWSTWRRRRIERFAEEDESPFVGMLKVEPE
jgi:hypothetical protein